MPPKAAASKKAVDKAKTKIVEDKTFGLKNKKGKKQQEFVKQVTVAVKGNEAQKKKEEEKKRKEQQEKDAALINTLFKPVEQKVAKGADPKSVLCQFFKKGQCTKGDKCKFSHDVAVERKAEKRNVYEQEAGAAEDGMEDWDQDKLEAVVKQKHGGEGERVKSTIICKYFLEALETSKYGWFWTCPNDGDKCQYKHALPAGYVLKKDKKRAEENEEKITLEDLIEHERQALDPETLVRVTLETFTEWKKKKILEKKRLLKEAQDKKKKGVAEGRLVSGITGRDIFTFNPEMAKNDDADADDTKYEREEDEEEEQPKFSGPIEGDDEEGEAAAADSEEAGAAAAEGEAAAAPKPKPAKPSQPVAAFDASVFATDLGDLDDIPDDDEKPAPGKGKAKASDITIDEDLFGADEDLENLDIDEDEDDGDEADA